MSASAPPVEVTDAAYVNFQAAEQPVSAGDAVATGQSAGGSTGQNVVIQAARGVLTREVALAAARIAALRAVAERAAQALAQARAAAAARALAVRAAAVRAAAAKAAAQQQAVVTGTVAASGTSQEVAAQTLAEQMLSQFGWSTSQFSCLDSLWERESGWNVYAENPSSGAYGIPQALPGDKMASAGADWQTDAATQISWGLTYIQETYGSPCAAWDHEEADGWYLTTRSASWRGPSSCGAGAMSA